MKRRKMFLTALLIILIVCQSVLPLTMVSATTGYDVAITSNSELFYALRKELIAKNIDAYYDLAKVYYEFGNYDSAIENFENVLEYKQDNELIYYYLAEAYQANDEIDKAISNFLKSIATNNKFTLAYKKVAILFMARGDYEDALEYLEDYLNFDIPQEEKDGVNKLIDSIKSKVNG